VDLESVFGQGGVDLGDLFGGVFGGRGTGGGRRRSPPAQKGEDFQTSILIPFQMAATGGTYDVSINRDGKVDTLGVKVPAGVQQGDTIRLGQQGSPGSGGGPAGDLLIMVQIAPHPYFRRDGNDVLLDCPLSVTEALLGTRVDVPTLTEGQVTLTIPAGTSSGAKLRLRGKGFPNRKTGTSGDQYVIAKIVVPKTVDTETRDLLSQLAARLPAIDRSEWR
jgi:curved DNA-binding protein